MRRTLRRKVQARKLELCAAKRIHLGFTLRSQKTEVPAARHAQLLTRCLTSGQRQFLLGLVHAEPDWSLTKQQHLSAMPAIAWKLANLLQLKKSNPKKFQAQAESLERVLEG
jgi:hypothetical protein